MVKQQTKGKPSAKGKREEKKRGMIKEKDRKSAKPLLKKRHSLKTKRRLEKLQPQVIEPTKTAMFVKGTKSSELLTQLTSELRQLKHPYAIPYTKKNLIRPFEDPSSLEFFGKKSDSPLFVFSSHSKKRPNNLTFGRFFDESLLDMIEIGVKNFTSMTKLQSVKSAIGSNACFVFKGDKFEINGDYKLLKSMLLDFFRGEEKEYYNLSSLDHVIFIASSPVDETIHFRHYSIALKKSGMKVPKVDLAEIGPSFDFEIRRTKTAAPDAAKAALMQPRETNPKKVKNISTNVFGQKMGRVHMHRQDFEKLQVKKSKALKRPREESQGKAQEAQPEGKKAKKD
uniref:Ribosome production factor 2 homolog n=1 Tax=Paramoeba aestuarina TaxID=180227 RepID=A0A7S4KWY1_9EUKA|mmetsp:Transcript_27181/g.42312  ORF Transcript_27181/g.42312 Transcript_27181/m.42312 type:complete len:340 (+) Transcript_27181:53-1072(+)